jgi:hypothetical protein
LTSLNAALEHPRCIVSVMGSHAGEDPHAIFARKMEDVSRVGITFWLMRSPRARPPQVAALCQTSPAYALFVAPATHGGARPTTMGDAATEYSCDRFSWHRLPDGISPVTGKLDASAAALVFNMLETDVSGTLDLWAYGEASAIPTPLRFRLGSSTVCAIRADMTQHPNRIKSRYRGLVAVARLTHPYCVWLR